jgi:NADH dehydrogenase [ubiquinone] 1 alpha subcomplex assembly factor 5
MTHFLFNRNHQLHFQNRAQKNFANHSFLFEWTKDQITDRLNDIKKEFIDKILLGNRITINDFKNIPLAKDDTEILPLEPKSCDCIVSILDLHTINDLPNYLLQIRHALRDDGLFLGALFGGETLYELRHALMTAEIDVLGGASPRVFPFADKQQIGALMQRAGFSLPVIDSEIIRTSYQTMFNLMSDIRGMGEQNCLITRYKKFTPSKLFYRAAEIYQNEFAETDGRVTASFEIIFIIGWAPHSSQQQPLKRGSATASLADIL